MALTKATYFMIDGISINVKDYGAKGDGITNDTAACQSAIDACPEGGSVYFPPGTYVLNQTATTGNALCLATTGTVSDEPDYVVLSVIEKKDIVIYGTDATLINRRGYVFYGLLNENVTVRDLRVENSNNPWTYTPPDVNYEPSAIRWLYCLGCKIDNLTVVNEYRGISFARTADCQVTNCQVFNNTYICISSYGCLYQPAGWTPTALVDYFSVPAATPDAGILFENNLCDTFNYFGIYSDGPAIITDNRIQAPLPNSIKAPGGSVGIQASQGECLITNNRIYCDNSVNTEIRTSTYFTGVDVKFEDIETGAMTDQLQILGNTIQGGSTGIRLSEAKNVLVQGNNISGYTVSAVNLLLSVALTSNLKNIQINNNYIGEVDTATTRTADSYNYVGGIVTSVDGTTYIADNIIVEHNTFNRNYTAIVNGTAEAAQKYDILAYGLAGTRMSFMPNYFNQDTAGFVKTVNNSLWMDRWLNQLPYVVNANTDIEMLPGIEHLYVVVNGATGNVAIKMPQYMAVGQKITIVNQTNYNVTINQYASTYFLMNQNSVVLTNSGGTADKARSSITMVCQENLASNERYTCDYVGSSVLYGGTVTY